MAEPSSSTAAGVAGWKIAGGILSIGVVASALGFMVLLPKTAKEAALRALATMMGSALFGPVLVAAVHSKWPALFASGIELAPQLGLESWHGLFMVGAPILAVAGLPVWWLLGAAFRWLDKRREKDLGELARDARNEVIDLLPRPGSKS
jgi:hypothetical protein